jgi:hypothetical protein
VRDAIFFSSGRMHVIACGIYIYIVTCYVIACGIYIYIYIYCDVLPKKTAYSEARC